ncbi:hypothetical protein FNH13_13440 [Ornithinimicrobium ciconiae]|uniref:Uncharacterized protein n=1 Tax=Ornithinimicrobium ciconiae TaxID=2594265 RepID=A0A516GCF3_9MICO|nr:hypothetical protein [Ornithinimicrobium ciconiae]QDO89205.1 hypothetical protein FNH13_13440 [Ornithinimicrobium ciconiae]
MGNLLALLVAALLATLGFTSCTGTTPPLDPDPPLDPGPAAYQVGSTLAQWDEGTFPEVVDNPEIPLGHRLITTETERDALLDSDPGLPDLSEVAAVDLELSVLVVGGYHSCQEQGAVYTNNAVVWFDAVVPASDEHIDCA